jgi:hypothetical protein
MIYIAINFKSKDKDLSLIPTPTTSSYYQSPLGVSGPVELVEVYTS